LALIDVQESKAIAWYFIDWYLKAKPLPDISLIDVQERDHALRVEDLQGEISQRERHISNLKEDAGKLQTSISHLNTELDFKRQEIQKVKVDTQNQIRWGQVTT